MEAFVLFVESRRPQRDLRGRSRVSEWAFKERRMKLAVVGATGGGVGVGARAATELDDRELPEPATRLRLLRPGGR